MATATQSPPPEQAIDSGMKPPEIGGESSTGPPHLPCASTTTMGTSFSPLGWNEPNAAQRADDAHHTLESRAEPTVPPGRLTVDAIHLPPCSVSINGARLPPATG
jgi:hypothetical protein